MFARSFFFCVSFLFFCAFSAAGCILLSCPLPWPPVSYFAPFPLPQPRASSISVFIFLGPPPPLVFVCPALGWLGLAFCALMHFIISSLRHASTALVLEVIEFVVCSLWSPHFVHLMVLFHPALALIIISLFVVCSPSSPLCCLLHIIFNGHRDVLSAASPLRPAYPAAPVSQFCLTVSCYPLLGTLSRLSPPAKRERK